VFSFEPVFAGRHATLGATDCATPTPTAKIRDDFRDPQHQRLAQKFHRRHTDGRTHA